MLIPYERIYSDLIYVEQPLESKEIPSLIQQYFNHSKPFTHYKALYLEPLQAYSVIAIYEKMKNPIIEPQILLEEVNDESSTLIITSNYFVVVDKKQILLIQNNSVDYSIEDLKMFVIDKFNFQSLNIVEVLDDQYKQLYENSYKLEVLDWNKTHSNYFSFYYIIYIFCLMAIGYSYYNFNTQGDSKSNKYDTQHLINKNAFMPKLQKVFEDFVTLNITITDFKYVDNQYIINAKAYNINHLYSLLSLYQNRAILEYVKADENLKIYNAKIKIQDV